MGKKEQKVVDKKESISERERPSKPRHEDSRSRRKRHHKSKRDDPIYGTKTAEKRSSKTLDPIPRKVQHKSKDRRHEKSSQKSSSLSKKDPARSRSGYSKEDEEVVQKKKRRYEASSSLTGSSSTTIGKINDGSPKKSKDMIKRNSQVNEIKEARQPGATETSSSSLRHTESVSEESKQVDLAVCTGTTMLKEPEKTQCPVKEVKESRQSFTTDSVSTLFKPTFNEIGSKESKIATVAVDSTPTKSCKAGQPSLTQKKPNCVIIGPHLSFKIHKSRKASNENILGKKKHVDATNASLQPEMKHSDSKTVLRHLKQQKTEKQARSYLEVTPHRSREVPTLSVKPQATVNEQPAPIYSQAQAVEEFYPAPLPHSSASTPIAVSPALGYNQVQAVEEFYPAPLPHSSASTPIAVSPALGYNQVQAVEEFYPAPLPHSSASTPIAVSPALGYNQVQVVEELYLARSEKRLEVNITESYGELTCMEIDSAEEAPANTQSTLSAQPNLIIVLDTNVLLSHLDYVKTITSRGLRCMGFPVILIPWVVLQELDSLKQERGLAGSVAHLAIPAISYIYNCIMKKDPHLCGQSMKQASESSYLKTENNDDRVLQCCLQYQSIYPECDLILCTNDKMLCCKAVLSGVKASNKDNLEAEIMNVRQDIHVQHLTPADPRPQGSTPVLRHNQEREERITFNLNRCVFELEECLHKVLSDVLEVEMEAVYKEIWLEIVFRKPPWTFLDVLHCFKKHWIAVFGHVVSRRLLQTVIKLIDFFIPGKTVDHKSTLEILSEVKEFLQEFFKRSSQVPHAISVIDNIYKELQPQSNVSSMEETSAENIVMTEPDDEDKQHLPAQVFHHMEKFTAVGYDPNTRQSAQPVGSQTPQQDALLCLLNLSSTVSQLLQALMSVLSMAPDMKEIEALLSIIYSMEVADGNSRVTAKDLLECFSQPDYREKLQCGMQQLMEMHQVLNHCIQVNAGDFSM